MITMSVIILDGYAIRKYSSISRLKYYQTIGCKEGYKLHSLPCY